MPTQLWPPLAGVSDPSTLSWFPGAGRWTGFMTPEVAKSLPGIARGVGLIAGQVQQMPMDDYAGAAPRSRPALLEQPDPENSRAWFVGVQLEDFLLNGNAVHYVTSRYADSNWPATAVWLPASWVQIVVHPLTRAVTYWVGSTQLRTEDVVHVKRGADRVTPERGVGIVEQHMDALGTVRDQHRYEAEVLQGGAVPSVAVIAPNPRLGTNEADAAKEDWVQKYGGPVRKPAILPLGSSVIPLAWSPSDSQLNEARKLSLTDQANMLNMDGYWLGADSTGLTYKSPGPMYLNLLRQTINPILAVFEDVWSSAWLPRGRRIRFDRSAVLMDDMQTMIATASAAKTAGLWTLEESRAYLGMGPAPDELTVTSPVATVEPKPTPPEPASDPTTEEDPS